ncbi:MAG: Holliday junction branch migration protein RuvA [bacterium]|jgi:Holliday junction DNA helicase RuvA|nr:Holliday junction branch migration protein RuvA [bacterium]
MIAFLEGIVVTGGTDAVVSVGGGIGLEVHLSTAAAAELPAPGEPVRLWTHLVVREDAWSLYGFLDPSERGMFRLLQTVSGIGPKVALGMLSKAGATEIAACLRGGDESALSRLPGIGKKTAARLVVELGNRLPELPQAGDGTGAAGARSAGAAAALAVLGAMGLAPGQAEQALQRAKQADPAAAADTETWVRAALRQLHRAG